MTTGKQAYAARMKRDPYINKKLPAGDDMNLEEKLRTCLVCLDDFKSEWAGNRICPRCKPRSH